MNTAPTPVPRIPRRIAGRRFTRLPALALALVSLAVLANCTGTPAESDKADSPVAGPPMKTLSYPFQAGQHQDTLLVMLPGINNSPTAFSAAGMVSQAQKLARVDVVAVDASIKYYIDRSVVKRLHREVILPARAQGYRHIWLVGSSMGGFGCLLYIELHPELVDGTVLLAPFLGEGSLDKELSAAGGLAAWQWVPGSGKDEQDRKVREIWHLLQRYFAVPADQDGPRPRILLGWGSADKFRGDAALLAAVMPTQDVTTLDGTHDWKTWARLFGQILPAMGLPPADR